MRYINFNGNIYPEHEKLLPVTNRSYRYGDGFFESMVMFNKKFPLLDYHWSRIEFTAQVLGGVLPPYLDEDVLASQILDLASVNDAVKNARVRIQFYRKGTGLYLPDDDQLGYSITMDKLENNCFELGEGKVAGMRDDTYKPVSMVSDIKNSSALAYVVAAQFAKAEGWDDVILLNHYGQVCEALYSNVVVVKNNRLFTPNLDSGCVNGVMRSYLLAELPERMEEKEIDADELMAADEILLTNAVKGIQWVREFKGKQLANTVATELTNMLNQKLLTKI